MGNLFTFLHETENGYIINTTAESYLYDKNRLLTRKIWRQGGSRGIYIFRVYNFRQENSTIPPVLAKYRITYPTSEYLWDKNIPIQYTGTVKDDGTIIEEEMDEKYGKVVNTRNVSGGYIAKPEDTYKGFTLWGLDYKKAEPQPVN